MRTASLLYLIPSSFAMLSCGPSATMDNRVADAAAIQSQDEMWSAAAAKNDLDGTVAFYAVDAVLLAPNAPIASDPKAIREAWGALLGPNTDLYWKVTKVEAAKSGELGYLYGTYSLSVKAANGGPPVHDTGKMVEVWKKQADGSWKCAVDIFNSDLPVPAAPDTKK